MKKHNNIKEQRKSALYLIKPSNYINDNLYKMLPHRIQSQQANSYLIVIQMKNNIEFLD
jgi:hypothetical protein